MLPSAMPCRLSHIPRAHGSAHRAAAAFLGLPQHRPAVDSATVEMQSEHKGSGSLGVLKKNVFIFKWKTMSPVSVYYVSREMGFILMLIECWKEELLCTRGEKGLGIKDCLNGLQPNEHLNPASLRNHPLGWPGPQDSQPRGAMSCTSHPQSWLPSLKHGFMTQRVCRFPFGLTPAISLVYPEPLISSTSVLNE